MSRYKPIRLDLLIRDAICAAEAWGVNAGTLNQAAEATAIETDVRQMKDLISPASKAIPKAVDDDQRKAELAHQAVGIAC